MSSLKRAKPGQTKPQRGRPKTSPLDPAEQVRERQRRHREKHREQGRVSIQLWIKGHHHRAIQKSGKTLQDAADEAFALLLAKWRGKSR
jgi:2,4-dienoyl-CoA reductase-like NADH-dependent reductase (Old Yellow Enzyme family)